MGDDVMKLMTSVFVEYLDLSLGYLIVTWSVRFEVPVFLWIRNLELRLAQCLKVSLP